MRLSRDIQYSYSEHGRGELIGRTGYEIWSTDQGLTNKERLDSRSARARNRLIEELYLGVGKQESAAAVRREAVCDRRRTRGDRRLLVRRRHADAQRGGGYRLLPAVQRPAG